VAAAEFIRWLFEHHAIADIEVRRPSLEEYIRRIYNGRLLMGNLTK